MSSVFQSAGVVLILGGGALIHQRESFAQACCAGGALVSPARLAVHEDIAIGLQMRARSNNGSFDSAGHYSSTTGADDVVEQDLAAAFRVTDKIQLGALVPFVETHRTAPTPVGLIDEWGGGLGDVSLTARYDFLLAAESLRWPGVAVLAAANLPTGTPPDKASHALATDATGEGSYELTLGIGLEKVVGPIYAALNGWVTHRFSRSVSLPGGAPVTEDFGTRWTLTAVTSYVFANESALGVFINALDEGAATTNGMREDSTALRLTTIGAAGVLPIRDVWRLQGTLLFDVPLSSFGRNELAGYGLTISVVRVWL
jgi:hypothetical protein